MEIMYTLWTASHYEDIAFVYFNVPCGTMVKSEGNLCGHGSAWLALQPVSQWLLARMSHDLDQPIAV